MNGKFIDLCLLVASDLMNGHSKYMPNKYNCTHLLQNSNNRNHNNNNEKAK